VDAQGAGNEFGCRELPRLRTIPCEVQMSIQDPLPAPQPMDAPAIRPALNLNSLAIQISKIQQFLKREREARPK